VAKRATSKKAAPRAKNAKATTLKTKTLAGKANPLAKRLAKAMPSPRVALGAAAIAAGAIATAVVGAKRKPAAKAKPKVAKPAGKAPARKAAPKRKR
jgi:hypothetical protein